MTAEGAGNHLEIDLGDAHGCAIRSDGHVFCWGSNSRHQSNPGGTTSPVDSLLNASDITISGGALVAAEVSAGSNFSCARRRDGSVVCWGADDDGIIDGTASANTDVGPTAWSISISSTARTAKQVAAGRLHACALLDDGRVTCRGSNSQSQLGRVGASSSSFQTVVFDNGSGGNGSELTEVVKIAAGADHTCALDVQGRVFCWGNWDGVGTDGVLATTTAIETDAIDIAAGGGHTCAIRSDHTMRCWGRNDRGQLGNSSTTNTTSPVSVSGLTSGEAVLEMGLGSDHTCAITTQDRVFCWGRNNRGQLSRNDVTVSSTSYASSAGGAVAYSTTVEFSGALSISAGTEFTCVAAFNTPSVNDGAVRCWGSGDDYRLGNGSTSDSTNGPVYAFTPDLVCGGPLFFFNTWSSPHGGPLLDSGDNHTCAFIEHSACVGTTTVYERGVACWGDNSFAQLGTGSASTPPDGGTLAPASPTFIPANDLPATVISLSAGNNHTCIVDVGGVVRCWGRNNRGQCGVSGSSPVTSPTAVTLPEKAVAVSAGGDYTCALLASGKVSCWGDDTAGTLGRFVRNSSLPTGSTWPGTYNASPGYVVSGCCTSTTQITNVAQVSAGENVACARASDGRLRCWGRNPTTTGQVGGSYESTRILGCGQDDRFCDGIIETNGNRLEANVLPHAGDYNCNFGSTIRAVSVSAHDTGACLLTVSGNVRCWGAGASGERGDGSTTSRINVPSTVQEFGTTTGMGGLVAVYGARQTKCAMTAGGAAFCWGNNNANQAGFDRTSVMSGAIRERAWQVGTSSSMVLGGVIAVTSGLNQSCAFEASGGVVCWGSNAARNLGRPASLAESEFAVQVQF